MDRVGADESRWPHDVAGTERFDRASYATHVRELSEMRPLRVFGGLASIWGVIVGAIWVARSIDHWAVTLAAVVVIATRQHALGLVMHDGAHYRLARSRGLNDWVSDCLAALPLGLSTSLYRGTHFAHHRLVGTDRDPDTIAMAPWPSWQWPKRRTEALGVFVKSLLGAPTHYPHIRRWSAFRALILSPADTAHQRPLSGGEVSRVLVWTIAVVAGMWAAGWWWGFLIFWLLPYSTFLQVFALIRGIAEHHGLPAQHELNATRQVTAGLVERAILAPLNSHYHLEHHLFPSVPYYNLPRLHRLLARDPAFRRYAAAAESYLASGPNRHPGSVRTQLMEQDR